MLREFLDDHRTDLIARCAAKVARRLARDAFPTQLSTGIPMFLDQFIQTLDAENDAEKSRGTQISGPSGPNSPEWLAMGITAAAHGKALFALDYTVGQVVHDYGDLCQGYCQVVEPMRRVASSGADLPRLEKENVSDYAFFTTSVTSYQSENA